MKLSGGKLFLSCTSVGLVGLSFYVNPLNMIQSIINKPFPGYEINRMSDEDLDKYSSYIKDELDKNILENFGGNDREESIRNLGSKFRLSSFLEEKSDYLDYYQYQNLYDKIWGSFKEFELKKEDIKKEFDIFSKQIEIKEEELKEEIKNEIPYNVDEQVLKDIVKNLPESERFKKYWIDITKNNDEGKITIDVFGRYLWWNDGIKDFEIFTNRLKSKVISGFKKYKYSDILSERVLRVFINSVNWIEEGITKPSFEDYKYGYKPSWSNSNKMYFKKMGSALLLDKEIDSPVYYIATNKHVINSIIPTTINDMGETKYMYTNHYKIQDKSNLPPLHISPTDAFFNWTNGPYYDPENANLKGYITFGSDKPVNGDVKVNEDFTNTIFEFKDKRKDIIKSIKLINDFTYPHITKSLSTHSYKWSPNKSFFKLSSLDKLRTEVYKEESGRLLDDLNKNSADFTILRVEFNNDELDPFKTWWKERPTKMRSLDQRDIFNQEMKQNSRFLFKQEFGVLNDDPYWTAGYSSYKNSCDAFKKINPNTNISIKKAKSSNGINTLFWTNYSKQNVAGKLRYEDGVGIQTRGSSGSPIFDKNGNALGLLWSGSVQSQDYCDTNDKDLFNLFFWFSQNLEEDLLYLENKKSADDISDFNIKPYNLINNENEYSFKSELRRKFPNKKTYLINN